MKCIPYMGYSVFEAMTSINLEVMKMKLYTVGILGATGAVGQEMMRILEERDFPVGKLVPWLPPVPWARP